MNASVQVVVYLVSLLILGLTPARATTPDEPDPNLPTHDAVCVNGLVSKRALAAVLLVNNKNYDAVLAVSRGPELWHTIFTDDNFCKVPLSCAKNPNTDACKAAAKCMTAKTIAVAGGAEFFASLNIESKKPNASYIESSGLAALSNGNTGDQVSRYFSDPREFGDTDHVHRCAGSNSAAGI